MKKEMHPTEKVGRKPKTSARKQAKMRKLPAIGFGKFSMKDFSPNKIITKLKSMNRNALLAISLGLVLVFVGLLSVLLSNNNNDDSFSGKGEQVQQLAETPLLDAGISIIEGTLQTKDAEGEWIDTDKELEIIEATALRSVGATSRAAIVLEDGSIIRLDGNSEIEFETLSDERVEIKHISGHTYSRVERNENRKYIVKSTDAQYEALGTAFRTTSSGDEQSAEVYQSSIIETSTNQTPKEGEKITVKSRVAPVNDGKVEKLDIEVVKKDQFIDWNRNLDLQSDSFKDKLGFLQDISSPDLTITSPQDGSTVLLEPNATQGTIEISGITEKNTQITVTLKTDGSSEPIVINSDGEGKFQTPVLTAPLGSALFEVTARDRTGNKTTKQLRITFQPKSGAISAGGIVLSTSISGGGDKVDASWAFSGSASAPDGVKIVYSKNENPSQSDSSVLIKSGTTTTIDIGEFESRKTYYFRACIYSKSSGNCGIYSTQSSLEIP